MITILSGVFALAGVHAGAITLGATAGGVLEAAVPWMTRAARARKAARLANRVSRAVGGRSLQPFEREAFTRDPTLV